MKMRQKIKTIWIHFIISVWAFGLTNGRQLRTTKNEDVGEKVFFYKAPNKTETLQIQPRNGQSILVPRQKANVYLESGNAYKSTMTGITDRSINVQSKRHMQNFEDVPILIYRGPHRPRELYHYRLQTKSRGNENSKYIQAASRQVDINRGIIRNNRFLTSDKNTKRSGKGSLESNPEDDKQRSLPPKKLYEDISILQEPNTESTISRPITPYYQVPEKQNYAIYAGGIFGDEEPGIENLNVEVNFKENPSLTNYKTTFKGASRLSDDPSNVNYSPTQRSSEVHRNSNAQTGPKRRSSHANQSKKLYSRKYGLENFTPTLIIPHPAYVDDQFEIMDHYDGGFSLPKPRRENPTLESGSYYGANNFGIGFDYENYDSNYRPVKRLHRASKLQPEYDGDLNFQGNTGFSTTSIPLQNSNRNIRNRNGRQRRRKGNTFTTKISFDVHPTHTDYEIQPYQHNADYQTYQSPSRDSDRIPRIESHDVYATTAAIENTYANVEIRRTQPKSASKSSSRTSGRNRRRRTTSRAMKYHR